MPQEQSIPTTQEQSVPTAQEQSIYYLKLPGQEIEVKVAENIKVILLKHRDVLVKIEDPNIEKLRVTCSDQAFYVPKLKHLVKKYEFDPGEEFLFWLACSFSEKIKIEKKTSKGWSIYWEIPVQAFDSNSYDGLKYCPAPITLIHKQIPQDTEPETASANEPSGGGQGARKYAAPPAPPQLHSCHTWFTNEFAKAAVSASQEPDMLFTEVTAAFFNMHLAGKLAEGQEYDISQYPNDDAYLNAKLQWKRENNYAPTDDFHHTIMPNSTVRGVIVALFNQTEERIWQYGGDLIGAKFTYYTRETKKGSKYFVKISGRAGGLGKILKGTSYRVCGDTAIKPLTMGFGTIGDAAKYAAEDLASMKNIKAVTGRWMFIGLLVETIAWKMEDGKDFENLFASLITSAFGTALTVGLAPIFATVIVGFLGAVSAPAWLVAVGGIVVVVGVGLVIGGLLDKSGLKEVILRYFRKCFSCFLLGFHMF
jgi:hypothetical protein